MWKDVSIMDKLLVQYIRNNNGTKKGIIISGDFNGEICIGWSLCNKLDKFNAKEAFYIAEGRAVANERLAKHVNFNGKYSAHVPFTVVNALPKFLDRVFRYYKDDEISEVLNSFIYTFAKEEA